MIANIIIIMTCCRSFPGTLASFFCMKHLLHTLSVERVAEITYLSLGESQESYLSVKTVKKGPRHSHRKERARRPAGTLTGPPQDQAAESVGSTGNAQNLPRSSAGSCRGPVARRLQSELRRPRIEPTGWPASAACCLADDRPEWLEQFCGRSDTARTSPQRAAGPIVCSHGPDSLESRRRRPARSIAAPALPIHPGTMWHQRGPETDPASLDGPAPAAPPTPMSMQGQLHTARGRHQANSGQAAWHRLHIVAGCLPYCPNWPPLGRPVKTHPQGGLLLRGAALWPRGA